MHGAETQPASAQLRATCRLPRRNEPKLACSDQRLAAAVHAEFVVDVAGVTLDRQGRDEKAIGDFLEAETVGFLGAVRVEQIKLYQSELKPTGAEYSIVYAGRLQESSDQ